MPVDARLMRATVTGKLQFTVSERHHEWYSRRFRDTTLNMPMSHGTREISDSILAQMARQLRLTAPQLREAIQCSFSREDYDTLLDRLFPEQPNSPQTGQGDGPQRRGRR
jgi:hypothetical protein